MKNCCTALVTPMKEGGEIDYGAFDKLVDFHVENGVRRMLTSGTTGESPTTTDEEKNKLLKIALEAGADATAGAGTNDTMHSKHLIKDAKNLGAERILLVDCYYNGPSSLELREEYYGYLCAAFPELKFIAYVIPGRTGCELSVDDLIAVHDKHPNLDTVKEATGNLDRMRLTRRKSQSITIMSGDDPLTHQMMTDEAIGAAGVISVASNIAPKAVEDLCRLCAEKSPKAAELAQALSPLFSTITVKASGQKFRNPVPVKTAMAGLGMMEYAGRKPLGMMTKEGTEVVRLAIEKTWKETPEILEPMARFYEVDIDERLENNAHWKSY